MCTLFLNLTQTSFERYTSRDVLCVVKPLLLPLPPAPHHVTIYTLEEDKCDKNLLGAEVQPHVALVLLVLGLLHLQD